MSIETTRDAAWWSVLIPQMALIAAERGWDMNRDIDFEYCLGLVVYNGRYN